MSRRAKVLTVIAIGIALVGCWTAFLIGQGLDRSDEWSNVVGVVVATVSGSSPS